MLQPFLPSSFCVRAAENWLHTLIDHRANGATFITGRVLFSSLSYVPNQNFKKVTKDEYVDYVSSRTVIQAPFPPRRERGPSVFVVYPSITTRRYIFQRIVGETSLNTPGLSCLLFRHPSRAIWRYVPTSLRGDVIERPPVLSLVVHHSEEQCSTVRT